MQVRGEQSVALGAIPVGTLGNQALNEQSFYSFIIGSNFPDGYVLTTASTDPSGTGLTFSNPGALGLPSGVQNQVLATPSGSTGLTALRTLVAADLPTIPVSIGGTGMTGLGTANQVLGVNSGVSGLEYKTITAGSNVTVTQGTGTITIAATGSGGGTPGGTEGQLQVNTNSTFAGLTLGTNLSLTGSAPNYTLNASGGSGTVSSVGITTPAFLTAGAPITTSGNIQLSLAAQTANTLLIGPASGGALAPTFRKLVTADLPAGVGTVASVSLVTPSFLSVSGSPITGSGTLTASLATQAANVIFAGPGSGGSVAPTFRSLVLADLPAGTGTVTSVGATVPSWLTAGSAVTSTGNIAITATGGQTANSFLATPNGSAGIVGLRTIASADLPFVALEIDQHTSLFTVDTPSAGTWTANMAVSDRHSATFAANTTLVLSNATQWQTGVFKAIQGASNWSFTPPAGVTWYPTLPVMPNGPGQSIYFTLLCTGTNTYDGFWTGSTTSLAGSISSGGTGLTALGTANQILGVNNGVTALEYKTITAGSGISVTQSAGAVTIANTGAGSVTSVALAMPAFITVTNSPVTSTGTLTGTLATQTANLIFAGPGSGIAAAPTFRALVAADMPTITSLGTVTTGVWNGTPITVANGGTGVTTLTAGSVLYGAGSTLSGITAVAAGAPLVSNGVSVNPIYTSAGLILTQYTTPTTASSPGATWTPAFGVANSFVATLSVNTTLALTNLQVGQTCRLKMNQAASGGPYTITFPAINWFTSNFLAPSMPVTASASLYVTITCTAASTYDGFYGGSSAN